LAVTESNGAKEKPNDEERVPEKELLVNIRRLTTIVLDKLEQGCKDGTLDQAQIRLLGSIGMRALGLWQETLNPPSRRSSRRLEEAAAEIAVDTAYVT
jgi:hypothetical protein